MMTETGIIGMRTSGWEELTPTVPAGQDHMLSIICAEEGDRRAIQRVPDKTI